MSIEGSLVCDGQLLVTDASHNRISIFTLDGNYVGKYNTQGTGREELQSLRGIATDSNGFIFASEEYRSRVSIFNKDGIFIHSFGSKGSGHEQFSNPQGIAISPTGDI